METIELWPEGAPLALGNEEEDRPRLTAYPVAADEPVGCVIVLPGGGYARRAPHEGEPVAQWLNSLGIAAFVLHYRVKPYRHPAPLYDVRRAVRLVRSRADEYGIDPNRIGVLGFSAGGHAAAMGGIHHEPGNPDSPDPVERVSSRPDLMVLCYPVISFREYRHSGSMANLIGTDAPQSLVDELSGELAAGPDTPPAFLWHTADDSGVPVENSLLLASALSRHKVPFELHVYESGRHGLGLAELHPEAHTWTLVCANWLRKRGFAVIRED